MRPSWAETEQDCLLLTPTIRDCVHLVTRGHFRSRDKDGGHTIRSAMSKNPMLHANLVLNLLQNPI